MILLLQIEPLTIISEQKRFYQELYTNYHGDDNEVKNFLNVLDIPKLTEEQRHMCEGKILRKDWNSCLRRFRITKCLEMTGFQLSFTKDFGHCLVLMNVLKIWKCLIPKSKH